MKLSIETYELSEKGTWISIVDWSKYDGGKVGTPAAVTYGDSKTESYNKLNELLAEKGHQIMK